MPSLGEPAHLILAYIYKHPNTTTRAIYKGLMLDQRLVGRYIAVLRKHKLIEGVKGNLECRSEKYSKINRIYKWNLTPNGFKYLLLRILENNIDRFLRENQFSIQGIGDMK